MLQVDDRTVSLLDALISWLAWVAGGVNSRQRSQSQRMSGSGQSASACRTWRNVMPLPRGFGSGTRTELAMSWSGQTRRCMEEACFVTQEDAWVKSQVGCDCRDSDPWEDKGLPRAMFISVVSLC